MYKHRDYLELKSKNSFFKEIEKGRLEREKEQQEEIRKLIDENARLKIEILQLQKYKEMCEPNPFMVGTSCSL